MTRKCAVCKAPARYATAVTAWCEDHGYEASMLAKAKAEARKAKLERKAQAADRKRVEPIGAVLARTQKACNAYVRAMYYGKLCFTCDRLTDDMVAGHYMPVGRSSSPVRFWPDNIRGTCDHCNRFGGGGRHPNYRPRLVAELGEARVQEIEAEHKRTTKWNRESLEVMAANFRVMTRELVAKREKE